MNEADLERVSRDLRLMKLYVAISTGALIFLVVSGFRGEDNARFDEIEVKKIKVLEENGSVRLVIANRARSPGGLIDGDEISPAGQRAGMIFYNDEGDENGGLIFSGSRDSAGKVSSYASLTFDRHEQDQVVALQYTERGGRHQQGLTVLDRPDTSLAAVLKRRAEINKMPSGPAKDAAWKDLNAMQGGVSFGAPRVFVGRNNERAALLDLKDRRGRSKLKLIVDSAGAPSIVFLNDSGRVVHRVPDGTQ